MGYIYDPPDGLVVVGPKASDNLWFRIQLMAVSDMFHALKFFPKWSPADEVLCGKYLKNWTKSGETGAQGVARMGVASSGGTR